MTTRRRARPCPAAVFTTAAAILALAVLTTGLTAGPRAAAIVAVLLTGIPTAGVVLLVAVCLAADRVLPAHRQLARRAHTGGE